MVRVIKTELEISHVTETIGLAFESFDFVVDAFDQTTRDGVNVVVQKAVAVMHQHVGNPFELFEA